MADEKEKKPKKPKKKSKRDWLTIIFFAVLVIGLIILTIIVLLKPTSKVYSVKYGDDFTIYSEIYTDNKIDIVITVGEDSIAQSGTYEEIKDDDIDNNYKAIFESDETTTELTFVVNDNQLVMTYDDGTEITLEEVK